MCKIYAMNINDKIDKKKQITGQRCRLHGELRAGPVFVLFLLKK
jgi:hypothetical protein